jgi:hypothetical protein
LNSLLASGRIDSLKNDSLRYVLTTWQDVVLNFQQFQEMHRNFVNNELMSFEDKVLPNILNQSYGFDYKFIDNEKSEALHQKVYGDMTYQNLLLRNMYWINIQLREIKKLERKMDQIIRLLEREIGI